MATVLYDINGQVITYHDLQDKKHWCKDGESLEKSFVRQYGTTFNYAINPEKSTNPYAPDLINLHSNGVADLKVQNTPFFKANELYGIEPTYAVVFNEKDKLRYERQYPDVEIVYMVDWLPVRADIHGKQFKVNPLKGIFRAPFNEMVKYLGTLRIHYYQQRRNDALGNAKGSYVLDIRNPVFERLL